MATNQFKVIASMGLNLRSSARVQPNNILANLPKNHVVTKVNGANTDEWWEVKTLVGTATLQGFVSNRFLLAEGSKEIVGIEKTSQAFRAKTIEIAARLGVNHNHLMAVMSFETASTFSPSIQNPSSHATGLIQFMPATAIGLGTSIAALASMTAEDQLDVVEKHFAPFRGRLTTLEDTYMAVLFPAAVGRGSNFVLFSSPSVQYRRNRGLDINQDGKVTAHEAATKVRSKILN